MFCVLFIFVSILLYSLFARHLAQSLDKLHNRVRTEKRINIKSHLVIRSFVIWPNGQAQRKINCMNNVKSAREDMEEGGRERDNNIASFTYVIRTTDA